MCNLFTIGHSQHKIEYFMCLLKEHKINYVLDVRSTPYSKHISQYNKENIKRELNRFGIEYYPMGEYFGARSTEDALYSPKGYLDFEKIFHSAKFIKGMENTKLGIEQGNTLALMCLEKDPIDCHRAIMVARAFDIEGIEVNHILDNGKLQTQKQLNERLVDKYFSDRAQLSLFDFENTLTEEDYIKKAFQKRNMEIGYYKNKESFVAI